MYEIGVNGKQTDRRTDGRPENIMLSAYGGGVKSLLTIRLV